MTDPVEMTGESLINQYAVLTNLMENEDDNNR
jgi:hypothetical protein